MAYTVMEFQTLKLADMYCACGACSSSRERNHVTFHIHKNRDSESPFTLREESPEPVFARKQIESALSDLNRPYQRKL